MKRKPHTKSRRGCYQCKQRHRKASESLEDNNRHLSIWKSSRAFDVRPCMSRSAPIPLVPLVFLQCTTLCCCSTCHILDLSSLTFQDAQSGACSKRREDNCRVFSSLRMEENLRILNEQLRLTGHHSATKHILNAQAAFASKSLVHGQLHPVMAHRIPPNIILHNWTSVAPTSPAHHHRRCLWTIYDSYITGLQKPHPATA